MDELAHTYEPPFVRQRTDSQGVVRELMQEMVGF